MKIKHLEILTKADYFHGGKLPCVVRIMNAAPSNATVAMHGHEFSELVLVASGSLKHLHKKNTETLKTGDFLIIHPGTRHGYAELSDDTVVYNLIFTDALREYAHLLSANPLARRIFPVAEEDKLPDILGNLDANLTERAVRLMDEIRSEEKSPSFTSTACCGALFAATVSLLARGLRETPASLRKANLLQPEISYINDHLKEKITVEKLRSVSGKSPSTLNRFFLSAFGKSPIDYLIERRLDLAEILCSTTEDTLAAISTRTGFADASHLIRTFRRHGRPLPQRKSQTRTTSLT